MRARFAIASIFVVLILTACSKPESAVPQADTGQPPSADAVVPMPDTAASTAMESVTGTVTQTSVSTVGEQVAPPAAPAASAVPAAKPVTPTPSPATKAPPPPAPAPAPATATVAPAPATTATAPAAPAPAPSTPPAAPAVKPATRASSGKAPKTHTVNHDGIMHAPLAENATQKCVTCHGKELTGGKVAKTSCLECHEKNWK